VSAVHEVDTGPNPADASSSIAAAEKAVRLERLLHRQRVLAGLLSIGTLTLTVTFFAMMTLAAPLLRQVVFGRSVTLANVAAVSIIVLFLASIAAFGRHATRIDDALRDARSAR
jgi:uncharacterized membrane protein (DUF485 family)